MGILNVTPNSFSDGGRWIDPDLAISKARSLIQDGADIIDVGAEATNPNAARTDQEEEWERLRLVLPRLVQTKATISVDTVNASTAKKALAAGVHIINDISGGSYDPEMTAVVADSDARFVVQHWRGFPADPELDCYYPGGAAQVLDETMSQVDAALKAGISKERIVIDPGLGFALSREDSWQVVQALPAWVETGYPVLVGASRKRFLYLRYTNPDSGTLAVSKICRENGVWAVRVHDVKSNRGEVM